MLHSTAFHYEHHLLRHDCQRTLGHLCSPSDYPRPGALFFRTCSERPLRDQTSRLPPPAVRDPNNARHHLSYEAVEVRVAAGAIDLYAPRTPVSQHLKAWTKANGGQLSPSAAQMDALTHLFLPPEPSNEAFDEVRADVDKHFAEKRMQRFMKAEEQQAALRHDETTGSQRDTSIRLLDVAAAHVPGISSPFALHDAKALLDDPRICLSSLGTSFKVLLERIFENREHIMSMLGFTTDQMHRVLQTPSASAASAEADDDPLLCAVCAGDATEEKPILKCDGPHQLEIGYHLECLPEDHWLDCIPPDKVEWLCPECVKADIYIANCIVGKETRPLEGGKPGQRAMHYQIRWVGHEATTWEPLQNLPGALNRSMIREYNRKLREEAEEMKSDAASSSCTAAAAPGSSATRTTPFTLSAKAAGKQKAKP